MKMILFALLGALGPYSGTINQDKAPSRTQVGHCTDVDIAKVDLKPVSISVEDLLVLRDKTGSAMDFIKFHDHRFKPFETTVYRLSGSLKSIRIDKEGDINFIVQGKTGVQVEIEIPEPEECKGSPLLNKMQAVRKILETRYRPKSEASIHDDPVTVEGIGFFGSRRKPGDKPFGDFVRMMPAIRIEFGKRRNNDH